MPDAVANARQASRDGQYHAGHAARAGENLRKLEASGRKLRAADAKRCMDYATQILGHQKYAPWLMFYTAFAGGFKEGWIPDNFYGAKVAPAIQGSHGHLSFSKSLTRALFKSASFPDVGSRINGALFDNDYQPLSFEAARKRFFEDSDRIIFKPDGTGRGKGISFFDRRSFEQDAISRLGAGVFQRSVSQHEMFDAFSRTSVANIRLTTVVEPDGTISLRAAYLGLGTGSDTHVRLESLVGVPVDRRTGALAEAGFTSDWVQRNAHPTSGEPFAGKTVPAFDRCIETVIAHHKQVPFVGCVGWDVSVDRDEQVQILEWNGFHNAINLAEASQGPCFLGLGWERFA